MHTWSAPHGGFGWLVALADTANVPAVSRSGAVRPEVIVRRERRSRDVSGSLWRAAVATIAAHNSRQLAQWHYLAS